MQDQVRQAISEMIESIRDAGTYKAERIISTPQGASIQVRDDAPVLNMCANNYLGLANHPAVVKAAHEALDGKVVLAVVRESEMHVFNVVHWIGDSQWLLPSCQQTTERGEVNHTHRAHHEQPPVTHMHADVAPHRSMLTHGE